MKQLFSKNEIPKEGIAVYSTYIQNFIVCVVFVTFVQISGEMFTNFYTNKNK